MEAGNNVRQKESRVRVFKHYQYRYDIIVAQTLVVPEYTEVADRTWMNFSSTWDENWSFAAMRHSAYIACNPSIGGIQDIGEITMNHLNIANEIENQFANEWSGKAKSFFFPSGWMGFKKFFSGYQGTSEQVKARLARPDSFICLP